MTAAAADVASQIKQRFVDDFTTAINDPTVLVRAGHPGSFQPDDIVAIGKVTMHGEFGPISPKRAQDVTWTIQVKISCVRGGTEDSEQVVSDRAHLLLRLGQEYIRQNDIDLGGLVWWCLLSDYEGDGLWDEQLIEEGREFEIDATFTAQGRITN